MEIISGSAKIRVTLNWYGKPATAYVSGGQWSSINKDLEATLALIVLTPGHHPDIDAYLADQAVNIFGGKVQDLRKPIN